MTRPCTTAPAATRTCVLAFACLAYACAADHDQAALSFSIEQPLDVGFELESADWDRIRNEGRGLVTTLSGCEDLLAYEYSSVPADIVIAGERINDVSVRKKGLLGSLSALRPSLRMELGDPPHEGRTHRGLTRLTLNNDQQDPTHARQCMTYALFERAGLPAPRCGLARVRVNGEDLGTYTNVEPIKKPFLRRVFGDDSGNLYESAAISEFTQTFVDHFDLKTNEARADRSDLDRVVAALEAEDDTLEAALSEVFDLDALITFWAMEVLTGHADGLTGNRNNAFLYHHPGDDRFHLIPWGTDGAFASEAVGGGMHLRSVFATSLLAARMYAVPTLRARYQDRLRGLLATLWDEDALVEQLQQIVAVAGAPASKVMALEAFIRGQRAAIETELARNDGRGPDVPLPQLPTLLQCVTPLPASVEIQHTWDARTAMTGAMQAFPWPDDGIDMNIPLVSGALSFVAGTEQQSASADDTGVAQVGMFGLDATLARVVYVSLITPKANLKVGTFALHGFESFGVVLALDTQEVLGLIGDGDVTIDSADLTEGGVLRGSWHGLFAPLRPMTDSQRQGIQP